MDIEFAGAKPNSAATEAQQAGRAAIAELA